MTSSRFKNNYRLYFPSSKQRASANSSNQGATDRHGHRVNAVITGKIINPESNLITPHTRGRIMAVISMG
jgi:hypothetical protein